MNTYDLTNLRVLIVDDSRYMIKIIKTLLDAMGVTAVRGVDTAENIHREFKNWQPDLIITDHIMEPITGLELITRIRSQEGDLNRFIPIILLTGYAHEDIVRGARFHAGADAVLAKPVSVSRLYACIVSIYESSRTFVDNGRYFGPDRRVKDRPFEGSDRRWKASDGPEQGASGRNDDFELELTENLLERKHTKLARIAPGRR